ncbi:EamA family transporter [Desulfitobacterium sp.]|uniref:EamA family transporter n=1 Tax=Desulfitobacterium sp. TaxID=49981 RepID=UPI002D032960|nr:EamA family transporter [Desulfitobacterium sp.]HVJ48842.1 EamA family transporter [Desulfitobacterium sp.]
MFMYLFSILLIIASNVLYNIVQKSTPSKVNPFLTLIISYLTAAIIAFIIFLFTRTDKGILSSLKELNWTSIVLGVSIVGLEFGYLMAYRAGWKISVGSLVANIALAVILIPIGILFFKEGFGFNKVLGAIFCIIGLVLINR